MALVERIYLNAKFSSEDDHNNERHDHHRTLTIYACNQQMNYYVHIFFPGPVCAPHFEAGPYIASSLSPQLINLYMAILFPGPVCCSHHEVRPRISASLGRHIYQLLLENTQSSLPIIEEIRRPVNQGISRFGHFRSDPTYIDQCSLTAMITGERYDEPDLRLEHFLSDPTYIDPDFGESELWRGDQSLLAAMISGERYFDAPSEHIIVPLTFLQTCLYYSMDMIHYSSQHYPLGQLVSGRTWTILPTKEPSYCDWIQCYAFDKEQHRKKYEVCMTDLSYGLPTSCRPHGSLAYEQAKTSWDDVSFTEIPSIKLE